MADDSLTAERVREVFDYDDETGLLRWRVSPAGRIKVGTAAGRKKPDRDGHLRVFVDGRGYFTHRLVWLHVHGVWPSGHIDHIDGNGANNRIGNLRDVTPAVNAQNQRAGHRDSASGILGVHYAKRFGRWTARIWASGRMHHLGGYDTADEAAAAYLAAKRRLHDGCTV